MPLNRPLTAWLSALLALPLLACSAAPSALSGPSGAPPPSAAAKPEPPDPWRVVVLDSQLPAPLPGVVWARLQPGARSVALLPPGDEGARNLSGARLFPGPSGRFAAVDDAGTMDVFQGGVRLRSLGPYAQAAFTPGGEVLAWDPERWTVFSQDGEMLRGGPYAVALSGDGLLIERTVAGLTRLIDLPAKERLSTTLDCRRFYPSAGRMLCVDWQLQSRGRADPVLHVISLASGEDLQTTQSWGKNATFAFNASGSKLASLHGDIRVYDVAANHWTVLGSGDVRSIPDKISPRLAFTADGQHVCAEEDGAVRIAPPLKLDRRTAATCFFVPRPPPTWMEIGLAAEKEWDAVIATFPVSAGFEPIARSRRSSHELDTEALSRDVRTAVVLERSVTGDPPSPAPVKYQALVIDMATGNVRSTIPVTDHLESYRRGDSLSVTVTGDGGRLSVCAPGILPGDPPCKSFDTKSGAALPFVRASASLEGATGTQPPPWGSIRASTAIEMLGPAPDNASRRVLSWRDEGDYLSIDVGTAAGIELHLNLPDTGERIAEDVEVMPDASMLAISAAGAVDLWQIQPIGRRATLTRIGGTAWAALYPDGTYEWLGGGDPAAAIACERDAALYPMSACASKQRPAGTLRAIAAAAATP